MSDSETDNDMYEEQADEEWDEWDGDEEEDDATKSLFSDTVLPNPEAAFAYDGQNHGFDMRQYKYERRLDDYEVIKVINYIRREVSAGRDPLPALVSAPKSDNKSNTPDVPWASDEYLNPVLPDDPLITYDYDEGPAAAAVAAAAAAAGLGSGQGEASSSAATAAAAAAGQADPSSAAAGLQQQLLQLSLENHELKLRIAALMDAALPLDVRQEILSDITPSAAAGSSAAAAAAGSSSSAAAVPSNGTAVTAAASPAAAGAGPTAASLSAGIDKQYFDSYSTFDIHQDMLSDKPRTEAYQKALTQNPSLIKGKTILDVGCGTGILSMFAARGGAAAVVGLDGSQKIADCARKVVAANGLDAASGGPINIIAGKVEELPNIGREKVDIIVSEWMGYALLFESMLDSVLAAREKWLKPGGALLPDVASIYVAGASAAALGTAFWKDVYGFSMEPIAAELTAAAARESKVLVKPVDSCSIVTNTITAHTMDLATMQPHQQDFTTQFELMAASSSSSSSSSVVAALVIWFDTNFSPRFCKETPVTLSTAPSDPVTHWAQAVLPLQQPVMLFSGAYDKSNKLVCRLSMARSRARHRSLDISLEYSCAGGGVGGADVKATRVYTIEVSSAD